ncbi:MAG: hypothetical protein HY819_06850 [Acidobacteria bacterium]|nr:hypothetical protein [Acidobacteriota bacterium]
MLKISYDWLVKKIKNIAPNLFNRFSLVSLLVICFFIVGINCRSRIYTKSKPEANNKTVSLSPLTPRPRPVFGAHFNFADPPNELIFHMVMKDKRPILAKALRDAGVEDLRISFHGYYSHLGHQQSLKLREINKLTNAFPWIPIEVFISFMKDFGFTCVLGVNVEEGPEVAVDLIKHFEKAGALNLINSVELGNEPFLSARPWTPEEYAQKSAEIIKALRPFKVKFAIAVIVGKDNNGPTKIPGDEYCDRTLATLDPLIDLKTSDDIYGAVHLYSRGVTPVAIDQFNSIIRKYSKMKYQLTEYNIRLSLKGNPHLTNAYAMEFARKLNHLIMSPDIVGFWIHSFPYHAINYWTDGRSATVIGFSDDKLKGEDLTPGWHLTPAGRVHYFYQSLVWNGDILGFYEQGDVQYWVINSPTKGKLVTILNDQKEALESTFSFEDKKLKVQVNPQQIVCYQLDTAKEIASLDLPY